MKIAYLSRRVLYALAAFVFAGIAQAAVTDLSSVPLNTYSAATSTDVKPNVFFILDDSGSMDWDYMPDWACASYSTQNSSCANAGQNPASARSEFLFRNAAYNGSYYNPAVRYVTPLAVDADGSINRTAYPSQTGTSTDTGGDANASSTTRNWHAVKDDAYGIQSTSTSNLQTDRAKPPYFFTMIAKEYCTLPNLKSCVSATAPSDTYKYPAVIRWCNSSNLSTCRATFSSSYNYVRAPSPRTATITVATGGVAISDISVGGNKILATPITAAATSSSVSFTNASSARVTGITVNSNQILPAQTASTGSSSTMATYVAAGINQCTTQLTGSCTTTGFYAVASGSMVTIYDSAGNTTYAPNFTKSGTLSFSSNPGPTFSSSISANATAQSIADGINACTFDLAGNCTVVGYTATVSGSVVTLTAPTDTSATPSITSSSAGISATAFKLPNSVIPGEVVRTTLTATIDSYPYPGTTSKASTRTDCAGTTCTYNEEMTNYANWWTYYRTRMQMMKTAATNAFLTMDSEDDIANARSRFRLGYMSINNNTRADFLNLDEFKTSQKYNWYRKLIAANPSNSTPLRKALAIAGRYYAGVLDGSTLNGGTVVDPLQYSCQQNYTILSTDGFWNEGSGYTKLDGATEIANQDVGLQRPYYDGGSAQLQTRTSDLQQRTGYLQIRTKSRWSWSNWTNTSTCTPVQGSAECRYNWSSSAWTNTSSCTLNLNSSADSTWNIATATDCQYAGWTDWGNASSCTPVAKSEGPAYTVGVARDCQTISSSGGSSNSLADVAAYYYNTDLRNAASTAPDETGTCTGPTIAPSTTANDLCANNVPANGRDVATTQHMTTFTLGLGSQGQMIYAPMDGKDYWNDTSGDFFDVVKGNTANSSTGICSWQTSGSCNWPVPSSNSNANIDDLWHAAINGHGTYFSASDPASLSSSLTNTLSTIVNTPRPGTAAAAASSNPNVSASDNYVFSSSYKSVDWYGELIRQQITTSGALTAQNWSARKLLDCATTSWSANTSYAVGDAYRNSDKCYYVTTAYSSGDSFDQSVDGPNIAIVYNDETATTKVAATPLTSRTIYTNNGGNLVLFRWTDPANPPTNPPNSLSDTQKTYFEKPAITYVAATSSGQPYAGLSQFCSSGGNCLSSTQQSAAEGEALVNYLRGDRANETTYFHERVHVLGDIVSSEARYVQTPMYNYTDTNYSTYKTEKASRAGRVYVGANDGMLHAFDAATGQEVWAYVPSFVLPQMYKLADKQYSTNHQYFVDGTPETGDICPNAPSSTCTAAQWKTILVGGLNLGGKGYYALDITDPSTPRLLWEFTDANMGYTYGNPTITKLEDGTWVVLISSGYNNADGVGRLYVLNANSGTLIRSISTGVGSAASPSGLSKISAHVLQSMTDNTTRAAYGGDMLGNLWRFDINNDIGAAGYDAHLLVTVGGPNGEVQPITVKPVQATVNGKPVVYAGTGRFLGVSDVQDSSIESFYAVKDNLDTNTFGNPRLSTSNFVQQTLTVGTCPSDAPITVCQPSQEVRLSTDNAVDWSTKNGWYLDFLTGGERSSTDPSLALGTLLFTTITPQSSSGSACGATTGTAASFIYALNYLTGGPVSGAYGVSGISLGSGLVTRPVMIEQADGTVRALIRTPASSSTASGTDDGSTIVTTPPVNPLSGGATRRISWRVLNAN
jgi:type IV pilus assembly protein PilY1